MDNWFRSKWFVRAISLGFAILLYIFVFVEINDSSSDYRFSAGGSGEIQTVEDVPVAIRIDENFVVSGVPEHVTVSLEGSKSILTQIVKQRNFDVFVDLEGLGEGEHTVEIEYDVPDDVKVYIEPKSIDVVIEERASKEFNISVDLINEDQLPEGYEIGETEINPSTVTITSSKSVIDQIAIVKVFVDVAGITESINNREVPVNVYDSQGNELTVNIEPSSVEVSAEVDNPSKTVPVNVSTTGELPEGYSLTSISAKLEEVEVFAISNILEGIDEVSTKEINLAEITESGTIDVSFALPDGARVPDKETVEVIIEIEQTKTIEDIQINVENLEDGQEVSFIQPGSDAMNVTVVGNDKEVNKLSPEDIMLIVNVEGLESGEHTVPVRIEGPENISYKGEYEQVTIEIA